MGRKKLKQVCDAKEPKADSRKYWEVCASVGGKPERVVVRSEGWRTDEDGVAFFNFDKDREVIYTAAFRAWEYVIEMKAGIGSEEIKDFEKSLEDLRQVGKPEDFPEGWGQLR